MKKKWTPEKEKTFIENVKYDYRGFICNYNELAQILSIEVNSLRGKAHRLRIVGKIPTIYWDDPITPMPQKYSEKETQLMIEMYQAGYSTRVIAKRLGRSHRAIRTRIQVLKQRKLVGCKQKRWTVEEDELLLQLVLFDPYGYTANMKELTERLNRSKKSVEKRILRLRQAHKISVLPDRTKPCRGSSNVMRKQINVVYQTKRSIKINKKEPTSFADEARH